MLVKGATAGFVIHVYFALWIYIVVCTCRLIKHFRVRVRADFPHKGPGRDFLFFFVGLSTPFNKQSVCRWSETPWHSCDCTVMIYLFALNKDAYCSPWMRWDGKLSQWEGSKDGHIHIVAWFDAGDKSAGNPRVNGHTDVTYLYQVTIMWLPRTSGFFMKGGINMFIVSPLATLERV